MKKKLVKTRTKRTDTLMAMACPCKLACYCSCTNCSGGGSFTAEMLTNFNSDSYNYKTVTIKYS